MLDHCYCLLSPYILFKFQQDSASKVNKQLAFPQLIPNSQESTKKLGKICKFSALLDLPFI